MQTNLPPQQPSKQPDAPQTQQQENHPYTQQFYNQQYPMTATPPPKKSGAIIGVVICLVLAMVVQFLSANLLFILYGPLYFVSFILSIVIIAQGNAGKGILTLLYCTPLQSRLN